MLAPAQEMAAGWSMEAAAPGAAIQNSGMAFMVLSLESPELKTFATAPYRTDKSAPTTMDFPASSVSFPFSWMGSARTPPLPEAESPLLRESPHRTIELQ